MERNARVVKETIAFEGETCYDVPGWVQGIVPQKDVLAPSTDGIGAALRETQCRERSVSWKSSCRGESECV